MWTVLPVLWAARGGTPAAVLLATVLVIATTIGAMGVWRFGPRRRSRTAPVRLRLTRSTGPTHGTGTRRRPQPGPDSGPPSGTTP